MEDREYELEVKKYRLSWLSTLLSILTPVILVYLTFAVQSVLKEREAAFEQQAQILKEKQDSYAELGRHLNIIYVFVADVGDYRAYTPLDIIGRKREADRLFHMYLPYWSSETEKSYYAFMNAAFKTYTGSGKRAQIRALPGEKKAAYAGGGLAWDPAWDARFTNERDDDYRAAYYDLVEHLLNDTTTSAVR